MFTPDDLEDFIKRLDELIEDCQRYLNTDVYDSNELFERYAVETVIGLQDRIDNLLLEIGSDAADVRAKIERIPFTKRDWKVSPLWDSDGDLLGYDHKEADMVHPNALQRTAEALEAFKRRLKRVTITPNLLPDVARALEDVRRLLGPRDVMSAVIEGRADSKREPPKGVGHAAAIQQNTPRPGPKPRDNKAIVHVIHRHEPWRSRLEEIAKELDRIEIPVSQRWRRKGIEKWEDACPAEQEKSLDYSLSYVKQRGR